MNLDKDKPADDRELSRIAVDDPAMRSFQPSYIIFPWQCPRTSAGIAFRNKRARFNHEVVDALYYAPYSIGRREASWMLR